MRKLFALFLCLSVLISNFTPYAQTSLVSQDEEIYRNQIVELTKSLRQNAKNPNLYYQRGLIWIELKDYRTAKMDFMRALSFNPQHKGSQAKLEELKQRKNVSSSKGYGKQGKKKSPSTMKQGKSISKGIQKKGLIQKTKKAQVKPVSISPEKPLLQEEYPSSFGEQAKPYSFSNNPLEIKEGFNSNLPWSKVNSIKKDKGLLLNLALDPEIIKLAQTNYRGFVSIAYGIQTSLNSPMTEKQQETLHSRWAPLFDHPSDNIISYMKQFIPIGQKYLELRGKYQSTASEYQRYCLELVLAKSIEDNNLIDGLSKEISILIRNLNHLKNQMDTLNSMMSQLGNPPNPIQEKSKRRKQYNRSLEGLQKNKENSGEKDSYCFVRKSIKVIKEPRNLPNNTHEFNASSTQAKGFWIQENSMNEEAYQYKVSGEASWTLLPPVIRGYDFKTNFNCKLSSSVTHHSGISVPVVENNLKRMCHSSLAFHRCGPSFKAKEGESIKKEYKAGDDYSFLSLEQVKSMDFQTKAITYPFRMTAHIPSGKVHIDYVYERKKLSEEEIIDLERQGNSQDQKLKERSQQDSQKERSEGKKEAITFHENNIQFLNRMLKKEREEAKNAEGKRKKDYHFRIIQLQSDIQSEKDLIKSLQTGRIVHTRSAFDQYAHQKVIHDAKIEILKADYVLKVARGVQRQIKALPKDQQKEKREIARRILSPEVIAKGDVETARKLALALHKQIQGHWGKEKALAQEEEINASQNEFYAQSAVMAGGMLFMGAGSAAFVETFGASSLLTAYAPNICGALYGGMTGLVSGGPKEALEQSVAMSGKVGGLVVNFYKGYEKSMEKKGATSTDGVLGGLYQAGVDAMLDHVMNFGSQLFAAGVHRTLGGDVVLIGSGKRYLPKNNLIDKAKFQQNMDDGISLVNHYSKVNAEYLKLKQSPSQNLKQISQIETELSQLTSSINSSYHCKWFLKYKGSASAQKAFNQRINKVYDEMIPEMKSYLSKNLGYDCSDLQFKSFRNSSSSGTVGMDLDLGLIEKPGLKIIKNGQEVPLHQFMNDAQKAMNHAYHNKTGFSGKLSGLNFTTSVHPEAFPDLKLLQKNVNYQSFKPETIQGIGTVIDNKMKIISHDPQLDRIAKLQAKCRESSKEIENMLLPMIQQKHQKNPDSKLLKSDLKYWQEMQGKLKQIGTEEMNPYNILKIDREIRLLTGGKTTHEVLGDLSQYFKRAS